MEVSDGRDEVESEAEAFSAVPVGAAEDTEAFECSQNMFDADTARR